MKKQFYNELQNMYSSFMDILNKTTKDNVKETVNIFMEKVGCNNYHIKDSYGLLTYALEIEWKMKWDYPYCNNTKGWYTGYSSIIVEIYDDKEDKGYKNGLYMLAEDLLMAYCRTNNVNDFRNTYDMSHYLRGDKKYLDYEIVIEE